MPDPIPATRVADIDWQSWSPVDLATLLFVIRDRRILLIHKKRGLGRGKINGPGGRLEPGEEALQAAVREVEEELCITPRRVREAGLLLFQFVDGYSLQVAVFTAAGCSGTPLETDEAIPVWCDVDAIPYDQMWADDRLWVPHMLAGEPFFGRFLFAGDAMVDHLLELKRPDGRWPIENTPGRQPQTCVARQSS